MMDSQAELTEIENWNRDTKLLAIKSTRQVDPSKRLGILRPLVCDSDPVIRGKVIQRLSPCDTDVKLDTVKRLLNLEDTGATILALELLDEIDDYDFSEIIEPLIVHDDQRINKTIIDILPTLPMPSAKPLFERFIKHYNTAWFDALFNSLSQIKTSECFSLIKPLFKKVNKQQKVQLVALASALDTEKSIQWVNEKSNSIPINKNKQKLIACLNEI